MTWSCAISVFYTGMHSISCKSVHVKTELAKTSDLRTIYIAKDTRSNIKANKSEIRRRTVELWHDRAVSVAHGLVK